MKKLKYNLILLLLLLLSGCTKSRSLNNPIIFTSRMDVKFIYKIIIGTDSQKVDSLFDLNFNSLYGHVNVGDTFGVLTHLRKFYVTENLEKKLHQCIRNNCKSTIKCSIKNSHLGSYYYQIDLNNKSNKSESYCFRSEDSAKMIYKKIKYLVNTTHNKNKETKWMLKNLKPWAEAQAFPISTQQKVILLKKILTPKQKSMIKGVMNLDSIGCQGG